jgi:hypothetical protein
MYTRSIRQLLRKSSEKKNHTIIRHSKRIEEDKNNTFANFARGNDFFRNETYKDLKNTPTIPNQVYADLPPLLNDACGKFKSDRDRDVFLTSALTILSGCFAKVHGEYKQRTYFANLYAFIIAPAASSKGDLTKARQLGMYIHNKLRDKYRSLREQFEIELKLFRKRNKNQTDSKYITPKPPKRKLLFMPGNSSSAAVIKQLYESDSNCIICETEADTMSNTLKQDWGGYSDLLRKAFQHESVSYIRKADDEYVEIENPKLSVLLSGTPSQVSGLIPSADDGLFSRFIYYVFAQKAEWQDVSPKGGENTENYFGSLAEKVSEMAEFLEKHPVKFCLTVKQWEKLNIHYKEELENSTLLVSEDYTGSVKRLGLITFRIAMTLSIVRNYTTADTNTQIICDESDFITAIKLTEVYNEHAIYMFNQLPRNNKERLDPNIKRLYDNLPKGRDIPRKVLLDIANNLKIMPRTTDKYLNILSRKGLLSKGSKYGTYKKG